MPSNYWLKLYHEALDDPKLGRLSDRSFRRVIQCFLLAGDLGTKRGDLPDMADVAWRLHCDQEELEQDLQPLLDAGILSRDEAGVLYVTQWEQRQAPMSDVDRQKRHRKRSRKGEYYGHEASNESVTTRDIELEVDTEKRRVEVEATAPPSNGDDPETIPDRAKLFRMIAKAGATVNGHQSEQYALLLEEFDIDTIALGFAEIKKQRKTPRHEYLRAILVGAKARGCKPGEWTPEKVEAPGKPYARDGPLRTILAEDTDGKIIELKQ